MHTIQWSNQSYYSQKRWMIRGVAQNKRNIYSSSVVKKRKLLLQLKIKMVKSFFFFYESIGEVYDDHCLVKCYLNQSHQVAETAQRLLLPPSWQEGGRGGPVGGWHHARQQAQCSRQRLRVEGSAPTPTLEPVKPQGTVIQQWSSTHSPLVIIRGRVSKGSVTKKKKSRFFHQLFVTVKHQE